MKKLVNKDPFSNGTEHMIFEEKNCDRCIKSSVVKPDGTYTNCDEHNMPKCSIQRDIVTRMFSDKPIKEETVNICMDFVLNGTLCKYLKTDRKPKRKKADLSQGTLS